MRSRLLLVEDHTLVRSGIRSLLEASKGIEVVGEAGDGRQAIEMVRSLKPQVVLMDIGLRELNGIDATRMITREHPDVRVLILSMHSDEQYIFEAMKAGANGYVSKSAAVKDLLTGIREVAAGNDYVSPSLATLVVEHYVRRARGEQITRETHRLTPREREVLQLIAEGRSGADIADSLFISVRTVETHRHNIMEKLGVHSIAGLTRFAIQHGLCPIN